MAWSIDKETSAVTMHRGDTGGYWVSLHRSSDDLFEEGDVAIYEVWNGKTRLIHREFPLGDDNGDGNGRFLISFRNSDTDTWAAGTYQTEIKVFLNPIRVNGICKDGDNVRTISKSKSTITILDTMIEC